MADRVHQLKTWPAEFAAIDSGAKRVELRRDGRGYQVGDKLILDEFDPRAEMLGAYTGRFTVRWVTHVQSGGQCGLAPGWVALSLTEQPPGGSDG